MDRLNWNATTNMINLYRGNKTAKLSPEQIACINLMRDLFVKGDPLPVTAGKRFQTDEELKEYYANLEKKFGEIKLNGAHGIFDRSFVISKIMQSYADKFYERRLNLAASHLSDVILYQMATALTHNKPLPIVHNDAADEYLRMVYHKTDISPNIQELVTNKSNERLSICTGVLNNLVQDILFGTHKGYYINNCLTPETRREVHRFRDNITYLVKAPLTLSTNVYGLIETAALNAGQHQEQNYDAISTPTPANATPIQQSLTDLAFENEALRRGLIQKLNIKYKNLPEHGAPRVDISTTNK